MKNLSKYISILFFLTITWPVFATEESKVVDLDFTKANTGWLVNRVRPDAKPARITTFTVYERVRGDNAIPKRGTRYASAALGRNGELSAVRFGNAGEKLEDIDYLFENGKPFTLEFWFYVYDVSKYFCGQILNVGTGHKSGFRMGYQKQKWSKMGWVDFVWGTKTGSASFWKKGVSPEKWHQIVLSYDVDENGKGRINLYIDGRLVEKRDAADTLLKGKNDTLNFPDKGERILFSHRVYPKSASSLDFKMDQLTIYNQDLSKSEVKKLYDEGSPKTTFSHEQEDKLSNLKLAIPHKTYGYFCVGESIPVLIDEKSEADELVANDEKISLPTTTPVTISFDKVGFYLVDLKLLSKGKTLKQVKYPVAITPFKVSCLTSSPVLSLGDCAQISAAKPSFASRGSLVGAAEIASKQPEVTTLGMKLSRVVVDWNKVEPKKGEYDWLELDRKMKKGGELGVKTILCFTGIPKWMTKAPGTANIPQDLRRYKKMWRLLINRYDGGHFFEVWNATYPGNSFVGGNEQKCREYVILLKMASKTIKKECSDAKVLAGRFDFGDGLSSAKYLKRNASEYYDIFSAKNYSIDPVISYEKSPWSAKIINAAGKPVWNTSSGIQQFARATLLPQKENGQSQPMKKTWPIPTVDEWTSAVWQIQAIVLELSDGVERIILETGPSEYYPENSVSNGLPSPKGIALAVFDALVGKDAKISRLDAKEKDLMTVRFENTNGKHGLIVFTTGKALEIIVSTNEPEMKAMDLYGNELSIEDGKIKVDTQPVYLLNVKALGKKE